MSGETPTPPAGAAADAQPTAEHAALNGSGSAAPAATAAPVPTAARPELPVGAAFAGGLALALLLKRLAR